MICIDFCALSFDLDFTQKGAYATVPWVGFFSLLTNFFDLTDVLKSLIGNRVKPIFSFRTHIRGILKIKMHSIFSLSTKCYFWGTCVFWNLFDLIDMRLLLEASTSIEICIVPQWLLCSSRVYSVRPLQLAGHFDVLDGSNGSCGQGS